MAAYSSKITNHISQFQAILKGKNVKRNMRREEPREYETTDEEVDFEDKMICQANQES